MTENNLFQQSVVVLLASAVVRRRCDEDQTTKIVFKRRALAPRLRAATVRGKEAQGRTKVVGDDDEVACPRNDDDLAKYERAAFRKENAGSR